MLTGKLVRLGERNPRFAGEVKDGNLIERVHQIVFDHKRDKRVKRALISANFNSVYTISIKTWQGNQVTFLNGYRCNLDDEGYYWENLATNFEIIFGNSSNVVEFDKIKSIQFLDKDNLKAQMTTISGKTIDISLSDSTIWLGGKWDKFGHARIDIDEVSSLEISTNVAE